MSVLPKCVILFFAATAPRVYWLLLYIVYTYTVPDAWEYFTEQ